MKGAPKAKKPLKESKKEESEPEVRGFFHLKP